MDGRVSSIKGNSCNRKSNKSFGFPIRMWRWPATFVDGKRVLDGDEHKGVSESSGNSRVLSGNKNLASSALRKACISRPMSVRALDSTDSELHNGCCVRCSRNSVKLETVIDPYVDCPITWD